MNNAMSGALHIDRLMDVALQDLTHPFETLTCPIYKREYVMSTNATKLGRLAFAVMMSSAAAQPFAQTGSGDVKPPCYLSVPDFKDCLGTVDMGGWTSWCMPTAQAKACPDKSSALLEECQKIQPMPLCPAPKGQ
jgi:hypothetical protein